jgi:hypothetical protein
MTNQRQFSSEENKNIVSAEDVLGRLKVNPRDSLAVMEFYETCGRELQEVAARHFGKNQLAKKAVLNLLAAVTSRAWSYDPQSLNASEWVRQVADAEARRLREALDVDGNWGRRARRAM